MVAKGQKRSSAVLLDHLVGAAVQRQRERDAESLGGLEVEEQLDLEGPLFSARCRPVRFDLGAVDGHSSLMRETDRRPFGALILNAGRR